MVELSELYNLFHGLAGDNSLLLLKDEDLAQILNEYIFHVKAEPEFRQLYESMNIEDDKIIFTMVNPISEDVDNDFTLSYMARRMVMFWIHRILYSKENVAQFFGEKEQKFYAQSNHMTATRSLYEELKIETAKLITDRGSFYCSYLKEG